MYQQFREFGRLKIHPCTFIVSNVCVAVRISRFRIIVSNSWVELCVESGWQMEGHSFNFVLELWGGVWSQGPLPPTLGVGFPFACGSAGFLRMENPGF